MSIFPTKILLATDGSQNADHATQVVGELSEISDSELHVVYVRNDAYSEAIAYPPEPTYPEWTEQEDPLLINELERRFEQLARRILDAEARRCEQPEGRSRERT
jgi:nucleotide-binding universal stress UspA family protein